MTLQDKLNLVKNTHPELMLWFDSILSLRQQFLAVADVEAMVIATCSSTTIKEIGDLSLTKGMEWNKQKKLFLTELTKLVPLTGFYQVKNYEHISLNEYVINYTKNDILVTFSPTTTFTDKAKLSEVTIIS